MARKHMLDTFEAARTAGPYDEYPVLVAGVDPQLHLSRNDRPQPFHLTCEKDTIIVQMSGAATVEMANGPVRYFELVPGDYAYIPAGTAHRILPAEISIMYRYKAEQAGLEAASFRCADCGHALLEESWDTAEELPQAAYLRIVESFNADEALRTCACGTVHPITDLTGYRWKEIADELSEAEAEAESAW